jgi:hypothetical protein
MPVLNIEGRKVKVDDSFMQLSEEEQHAKVDDIAKKLKIMPSMAEGVGRAAVRGIPVLGALASKINAAEDAALAPIFGKSLGAADLPEDTFGARYSHRMQDFTDKEEAFHEAHPYIDTAAEIAGGIASTGAIGATAGGAQLLGLTGRTLGQLATRGAISGAGINSADAALQGDNPLTAGGIGAVVGAVSPAAGRLVNIATRPLQNTIRAVRDPIAEGERRVAGWLDRDMKAGDVGVTPQEFTDARDAGQPVTLIDAGGETTRAGARSAANTSPEARAELNRTIDDRFESQSPRFAERFRASFNYPNTDAQQEAIDKVARTVNRPGYAKAYSEGANLKFDDSLEQISQAPVVQDAIRKTMVSAKNDAAKSGFTPPKNPFGFDETGRLTLKTEANGNKMEPNLQFWDIVKRNLDKTGTPEARDWARILREHLDTVVPSYATARSGAASFFHAGDALEAGQNFVGASEKFGLREARKQLAKMSPEEKQLFADGYADRLIQTIEKNPDRRSIVNKIARSGPAKEELEIALGRERTAELMAHMHVEGVMDLARPAVQGNSTTARQLVELGLAGGVGGYEGYQGDPEAIMKAALVYGAARGHRVIDERVAREVARLLVSNDAKQLDKGIRILSRNQNMMGAIRNADAGLAAIAARGATPGASQAAGITGPYTGPNLGPLQPRQQ